jgi:hypothetical protein
MSVGGGWVEQSLQSAIWEGEVRAFALVVGLLLVSSVAHSETDVFMRAVGFAFSGRDDWEPKVVDRTNCIFEYQDDVFYLNNVQVDRISIQGWENKSVPGMSLIIVGLHGDDIVAEHGVVSTDPTDPKAHRQNRKEYELRLKTGEVDRVKRAWEYIYSHGCVGKKSPF